MRRFGSRPVEDREIEAAYADLVERRGPGRPYVVVNMVASADGAISVEGRTKALSSEADRYVFHYLRSLADVILVGAQTVRAEGYGPPRMPESRQAERIARGQDPVPRIAVVSGSLDLDWTSALFADSSTRPFVLTSESADEASLAAAREVADVLVVGAQRAHLPSALVALGEAGVGLVLCEGGPTLNGVLATDDLIDELCLTLVPTLAGGDAGAGLLGATRLHDLLPMDTVHLLEGDGDLFLRYRRKPELADGQSGAVASEEASTPVEEPRVEVFHDLLADQDGPMMIVTATDGGERAGCLIGFASQCSIAPPRFMVWLSKKNHTYRVARKAEVLAVHLPAADQRDLADHFGSQSGDDVDKFATVAWSDGPEGTIVLDDVPRWFVGRITETLDSGDHVAFMLQPIDGQSGDWSGQLGYQAVKDLTPGHEA